MDFKVPVRPGDTVRYTLTVTGKRPSNSIPGWGLLFNLIEAHNQHDQLVYSADLVGFSKRRDYRMPFKVKAAMALARLPGLKALARR
jgi:acyl dehydratase